MAAGRVRWVTALAHVSHDTPKLHLWEARRQPPWAEEQSSMNGIRWTIDEPVVQSYPILPRSLMTAG